MTKLNNIEPNNGSSSKLEQFCPEEIKNKKEEQKKEKARQRQKKRRAKVSEADKINRIQRVNKNTKSRRANESEADKINRLQKIIKILRAGEPKNQRLTKSTDFKI